MKHRLREPKSGTLDDWDKSSVRPVLTYTAHAASMQLLFADHTSLPAEYRGDAFATMHGSWNRSPPSGYEVVRIRFETGQPRSIEPFVSGFLLEGNDGKWGRFARPFGLAVAADGSGLLGDEQNGALSRIPKAGGAMPGTESPRLSEAAIPFAAASHAGINLEDEPGSGP